MEPDPTIVTEIEARTLLASVPQPDHWFGLRYNLNLYRGCQHRCIYCDSRSACYRIEDFDGQVLVKSNAISLLRRELARKRIRGTVGLGSMNDCYMPLERNFELTRRALEAIDDFGFAVHILTKSDLVTRDVDVLSRIAHRYATVSFTITTADDALGRKLEPGATPVSGRFRAMRSLADRGISTGVSMMPILPFIEDDEDNIAAIVRMTKTHGGTYIIPAFGMTMRDRQRAHFYDELDRLFPGVRARYENAFGDRYSCSTPSAARLSRRFQNLCEELGIAPRITPYTLRRTEQLGLFGEGFPLLGRTHRRWRA